MRVDLLAQYLAEQGLGAAGVDLFAHRMPEDCPKGVVVRLSHTGVPVNLYIPGYYKTTDLQVIVRSPDQQGGDQLAAAVNQALTFYNKTFVDDAGREVMTIKQIYPTHLPIVFPRLTGEELEWSTNFSVAYDWTGAVVA